MVKRKNILITLLSSIVNNIVFAIILILISCKKDKTTSVDTVPIKVTEPVSGGVNWAVFILSMGVYFFVILIAVLANKYLKKVSKSRSN